MFLLLHKTLMCEFNGNDNEKVNNFKGVKSNFQKNFYEKKQYNF